MTRFCVRMVFYIVFAYTCTANAQSSRSSTSVTFRGTPSGGTITLMPAPGWNSPYVITTIDKGESTASVISRLALDISCSRAFAEMYRGSPIREIRENMLVFSGSIPWILGGTDAGINILDPPAAVSASYDVENERLLIEWCNPVTQYDTISIIYYGTPLITLPGDVTRYVHERKDSHVDSGFSSSDITVFVMGQKGGTPSNGVGVRLKRHVKQEALMNVPFTQGLTPGFEAWMHNPAEKMLKLSQGNLPGMNSGSMVQQFQGKGFFQILEGNGTFCGGISRRFLGLNPGHSYRVSASMNTLQSHEEKWEFSFHAACCAADDVILTAAQMAGLESIPDASIGSDAGLIARHNATSMADGWISHTSGTSVQDIILPSTGSSSITVWFRFEGTDVTNCQVGVQSVTIEDLGKHIIR